MSATLTPTPAQIPDRIPVDVGPDYTIEFRPNTGHFYVLSSKDLTSFGTYQTLSDARNRIDKLLKAKPVRIHVEGSSTDGKNFVVYGRHRGNDKWLLRREDGEKSQEYSFYCRVGLPLSPAMKAEYQSLLDAESAASKARIEWWEAHSIPAQDFRKKLDEALSSASPKE